jgi:transcriptional regulator with XRE-family HTH domain
MIEAAQDQLVLGRALRALRQGAGMTQGEVGVRAGTDDTHVSRMERGQFDVRWHTLQRLLRALDATLADLADAIANDPKAKD